MVYVRVRDNDTKHEFDVLETSPLLSGGLVTPVKSDRYPPSRYPRPPKHYLKLGRTGQEGPAGALAGVAAGADGSEVGEDMGPADS